MKKTILVAVMLVCAFSTLRGAYITDSLNYTVRLGYSIGGTAPIGMPATIRSLNKYTLQPNYSLGVESLESLEGYFTGKIVTEV